MFLFKRLPVTQSRGLLFKRLPVTQSRASFFPMVQSIDEKAQCLLKGWGESQYL